ncbi:MAG: winged helix-turn-helix transcriptional regulator [Lachnospiraceae bacterium]|nr:winged helix-turn-helix transcriptional regulator [Lachnospiraceae bacterium]
MGIADVFKVLSDPQRREILMMLKEGSMTAGDIAARLEVTPAALSYHLKLLKNADLVMEYKQKNFIYYELNTTVFDDLVLWIKQFGGNG